MPVENLVDNINDASNMLKAMANARRLMVLCMLHDGEKSVGELERLVGLSQSALSQHLARLRRDGIVRTRREAQTIYYSIDRQSAQPLINCLQELFFKDEAMEKAPHATHAKAPRRNCS